MIRRPAEGDRGRKYTERYRWNQLPDEHDSTGEEKLNTPNMDTPDCQNKTGNRQSKTLGLNKWTGKWQWETRHGSNYGTRTEDTTGWETWRWTQGEHGNKAGKQDTWTHTHTRRYTETASVTGLTLTSNTPPTVRSGRQPHFNSTLTTH